MINFARIPYIIDENGAKKVKKLASRVKKQNFKKCYFSMKWYPDLSPRLILPIYLVQLVQQILATRYNSIYKIEY